MRGRPWAVDVDRGAGAGAALVFSAAGLLGTAGLPAARRERRAADDVVFALSTIVSEYGLLFTERILPGGHSHSLVAVGSVPWLPWAASLAL